MSEVITLSAAQARAFCLEVLAQAGVPAAEAKCCTESLLHASLRGVDSHGVAMLPTYIERIRSRQIVPGRSLVIRQEGPATALVDGQQGLGPVLACAAMDLAQAKARQCGVGAVNLVNGNYLGALAYYVERPARQGLLGLCAANSTPRVAPHGGRVGLHGTNPIAYAVPTAGGEPMVFDAATGHAAARVKQAFEEGRSIAPEIALDREGRPTTDAAAALAGVLLPVGGTLGYGLGLLVDLLCGGLAGGPCGPDVPAVSELKQPYGCGFFALVLDPAHFGGVERFAERAGFLAASARATLPAAGVDRVRAPGDRGRQEQARRQGQGLPFARQRWEVVLDKLAGLGLEVGRWQG
ncbi:MAG: Ldh family oxidoreductase [Candidatus Handelsmanbacteria bacterium]|nr:Ldh family oxidoreductase [Candidatus Handelsmanbacteria bacterium]